jgi:hypothetical protein
MSVLAHHPVPRFEERRLHTPHRERVLGIAAIWGVLTLVAAAAAYLQSEEPAALHPVHLAPLPVSPLQTAAPGAEPARWIGVEPSAPDSFEPPAPTF